MSKFRKSQKRLKKAAIAMTALPFLVSHNPRAMPTALAAPVVLGATYGIRKHMNKKKKKGGRRGGCRSIKRRGRIGGAFANAVLD